LRTSSSSVDDLPEKFYLTPKEMAAYWRVSVSTIYRWIANGGMDAQRPGGVTIRIPRTSIPPLTPSTIER